MQTEHLFIKMTPQQRTEIERAIRHLQDVMNQKTGSELVSLILARELLNELIKQHIIEMQSVAPIRPDAGKGSGLMNY